MIKKTNRLSTKDFMEVMNNGRVGHSSLFLIRNLQTSLGVHISIVAPKKVVNTAAERNRIRRQVYNIIRIMLPNIKEGTHAIFFVKKEVISAKDKEIENDLKSYFSKK